MTILKGEKVHQCCRSDQILAHASRHFQAYRNAILSREFKGAAEVNDASDALKAADMGRLRSVLIDSYATIGAAPELLSLVAARSIARGASVHVSPRGSLSGGALVKGYLHY
jgi:hypothetical protein